MRRRKLPCSLSGRHHSIPGESKPYETLSIVEDQSAGGAQSTTTRKITTDGKPATLELNGYPATCSAVWEGQDIVATTNMESVGLKFTDRMPLSPDGKTLTSKVQISSSQGDGELTIVFDRQ